MADRVGDRRPVPQDWQVIQIAQDLYSATTPYLYLSKAFGFSSFRLGTDTVVRRCCLGTAYTLLTCALYLTSAALFLAWDARSLYSNKPLTYVTASIVTHCVKYGVILSALVINVSIQGKVWEDIWRNIAKVKTVLGIDHEKSKSRMKYVLKIQVLALSFVCATQIVAEEWNSFSMIFIRQLFEKSLTKIMFLIVCFQYGNCVLLLRYNFGLINQKLTNILEVQSKTECSVFNLAKDNMKEPISLNPRKCKDSCLKQPANLSSNSDVLVLRKAYGLLMNVLRNVNRVYSVPAFFVVLFVFGQTVLAILAVVQFNTSSTSLFDLLLQFCRSLWLAVPVVTIRWLCQRAVEESNLPMELINNFLLVSNEDRELENFSRQVERSRVHFKAGGVVSIEKPLLMSYLVVSVTYLVIVLDDI